MPNPEDYRSNEPQKNARTRKYPKYIERLWEDPAFIVQVLVDFDAWVASLTSRQRLIARLYQLGYRTGEIAKRLGVTSGAVSQVRSHLRESWRQFTGEEE